MKSPRQRTLWVLEIVGLASLGSAGFAASSGAHDGVYLASIYEAYPSSFWLLIAICLLSTLVAGIMRALNPGATYGWLRPYLMTVAALVLVLYLPLSKHYALMGQWDEANHLRLASDIVNSGVPTEADFYPAPHLLLAAFAMSSGLSLENSQLVFSIFFYCLYLANVAFATSTLTSDNRARRLSLILATPLLFGSYIGGFRPTFLAVIMLPLFVGFLVESRVSLSSPVSDKFILVLVALLLPFVHPWAVIAAATFLLSSSAFVMIRQSSRSWGGSKWANLPSSMPTLLGILLVSWLAWFMSFRLFGTVTERIYASMIESVTGAHSFAAYVQVAQHAGTSLSRLTSMALARYGNSIFYLTIAGCLIVAMLVWFRPISGLGPRAWLFPLFIIGFSLLAAISLFRDLVTASPLRLSNFAVAVVPLFLIPFIERSLDARRRYSSRAFISREFLPVVVVLVSIVASALGLLGAFASPFDGEASLEMPYSQQAGLEFITSYAVPDESRIVSPFRGAFTLSAIFDSSQLTQLRRRSSRWWIGLAEDHLGLVGQEGQKPPREPLYLLISAQEDAYYSEVWPTQGRINRDDFERLYHDPRWQKVYSSGGLDVWRRDAIP